MKKIINGKKYDTETAVLICGHDNGRIWSDFYFYKECLYKKKTGEFFIYEEGGAASCVAEMHNGYSCGGSRINPISEYEAMCFVEKYGTAEAYESLFGEVEE